MEVGDVANASSPALNNMNRTQQLEGLFGWADYLVFISMLILSGAIGVFYGFFAKKESNCNKEFLLAGKSMTALPVALSLIASFMSAITLLGIPAEVYEFGMMFCVSGIAHLLVAPSVAYLYMPVFWDMQLTSAYEYLERRFHPFVRKLGSAIFIIQMVLYMAIVVYAPALVLSQVTGVNMMLSMTMICIICIFYTTIGGMKAVLWTDTFQVVIMYGTVIAIAIIGTIHVGGINIVWQRAVEGGRTHFIDLDMNPFRRNTFWTISIGGYFTWMAIYGCNQAQVQRYLCTKDIATARKAMVINAAGLMSMLGIMTYTGLLVHAKYFNCDPVKSGVVSASDQIFPLFVMETMGKFKGLPGIFVAGIFAGGLSTVSSGINSLAAITLEDFIKDVYPNLSARRYTIISKLLSFSYGIVTLVLVFFAEDLGAILEASLTVFGAVGGPLFGMFTLGMFFPWANSIGCFVGGVVGVASLAWLGVGQHMAKKRGFTHLTRPPIRLDGCQHSYYINSTITRHIELQPSSLWSLSIFNLSYLWYSGAGCFIVIIVGMLVSLLTGKQNVRTLNPKMLSPGFLFFQSIIPGIKGLGEDYVAKEEVEDNNSPASILLKEN